MYLVRFTIYWPESTLLCFWWAQKLGYGCIYGCSALWLDRNTILNWKWGGQRKSSKDTWKPALLTPCGRCSFTSLSFLGRKQTVCLFRLPNLLEQEQGLWLAFLRFSRHQDMAQNQSWRKTWSKKILEENGAPTCLSTGGSTYPLFIALGFCAFQPTL